MQYMVAQLSAETEQCTALRQRVRDVEAEFALAHKKAAQSMRDMAKQLQLASKRQADAVQPSDTHGNASSPRQSSDEGSVRQSESEDSHTTHPTQHIADHGSA